MGRSRKRRRTSPTPPKRDGQPRGLRSWWKRHRGIIHTTWIGPLVAGAVASGIAGLALLPLEEKDADAPTGPSDSASPTLMTSPVSATPQNDPKVPFDWVVEEVHACDQGWWFPQRPDRLDVPPPADLVTRADWAAGQGALPVSPSTVEVVLRGKTSEAVVLRSLYVEVVRRDQPPTGTALYAASCGAGPLPARLGRVDLDARLPKVSAFSKADETDRKTDKKPLVFPYEISNTEPEVFHITADTRTCDCTWILKLSWAAGKDRGTVELTASRPIRTVAEARLTSCESSYGEPLACA
ncbi:hypothetical protein [Nonomuraea basaltis]|uniref:hypothetical protein n=1 Tax=Nonomuraea basaltis TaxID=2495887 RepID=UPI00110C430D|nr:hypothetical protein [Nonomuraea basaltis]TMR89017.1 hypothetical protein EJK15_63010 [Nonomuraea basaltis]